MVNKMSAINATYRLGQDLYNTTGSNSKGKDIDICTVKPHIFECVLGYNKYIPLVL